MKKSLKITLAVAAALAVCYFMPFITVSTKDSSGRTWRVPFGSSFVSDDGTQLTFSSLRSAYALSKDGANAYTSYTEATCYGKTYHYDDVNDVSFTGYTTKAGLMNELVYTYESGNACAGWTSDDEIAWKYGDITEVDLNTTAEEAGELGWLYIEDGTAANLAVYNNFSRCVKQEIASYLRALVHENGTVKVIDIQLKSDGTCTAVTWDGKEKTAIPCDRITETGDSETERQVYAANGAVVDGESTLLFTVK